MPDSQYVTMQQFLSEDSLVMKKLSSLHTKVESVRTTVNQHTQTLERIASELAFLRDGVTKILALLTKQP